MIADHINQLDDQSLRAALTKCCASPRWVDAMASGRPYSDDESLLQSTADVWWNLGFSDWLAAFAAHPKIGDVGSLRSKFANSEGWASGEQSGIAGAADKTLARLAELNSEYLARFGYIFIVCATGKTADEILAILDGRLTNAPDVELRIAAEEQLKITLLRLRKLTE